MKGVSQEQSLLEGSFVYKATVLPQGALPKGVPAKDKSGVSSSASRQYAAAFTVNLLTLSAGCVYGWASPADAQLTSRNITITPIGTEPVSKEQFSWLASIPIISGLLGAFVLGALADRLGRKKAGYIGSIPFILSWLMMAFCDGLPALFVARIAAGIGIGGSAVVSSIMVGETASSHLRGKLGTLPALGINSGILVAFILGSYLPFKIAPLFLLVLPVATILCLVPFPETPPYLLKKDMAAEAYRSLQWYRGDQNNAEVDDELDSLKDAAALNAAESSVSFKDFIFHKGTRRALIVNIGLIANQQFSGVMTLLNYTQSIFTEAGSSLDATSSTIIVGVLQAVCTYLSSSLIDKANRRTLLAWSNAVMIVCISTLGVYFYVKSLQYNTSNIGWLPVVCLSLYVMAFSFGLGPVPLVIIAETFSIRVKGIATSIVFSSQLISAFICTKFFSQVSDSLGIHGALFLFAGFCTAGLIFIITYVIETKDKPLDQILLEYNGEQKQSLQDALLSASNRMSIDHQVPSELHDMKGSQNA